MTIDVLLHDAWDGLWPSVTIDIVAYTTTTGNPEDSTVYTGLKAYQTQRRITEKDGLFGEVSSKLVDIFYVPRQADGSFPGISEEHRVRLNGTDREIISASDQGAVEEMLELIVERAR